MTVTEQVTVWPATVAERVALPAPRAVSLSPSTLTTSLPAVTVQLGSSVTWMSGVWVQVLLVVSVADTVGRSACSPAVRDRGEMASRVTLRMESDATRMSTVASAAGVVSVVLGFARVPNSWTQKSTPPYTTWAMPMEVMSWESILRR